MGMNQTQFAALGGVGKETQLNYESGLRKPDSDYLQAVAQHGVDVLYLITGARAQPASVTPEEASLLDNYRQSGEKGRAAARSVLDALAQPKTRAKKTG